MKNIYNCLLKIILLVVMMCNINTAFAAIETIEGNYILTSNKTVKNNDTLVIKGNLTIDNNKTLTIKNNAVLRVIGNLTINSKATLVLNNSSKLLVSGNVTQKESLGFFVVNTGDIDANKAMIIIEGNYIVETLLGWNSSSAIDNDKNDVYVFGESTFNQDKYGNEVSFLNDTGFSSISSFLPIELKSFTAIATDYGFAFNWVTASEVNNDYFALEYSIDGVEFNEIDYIHGAGTTSETQIYDYYWHETLSDEIVYFRLKQTDFNSDYSYSDVIVSKNKVCNPCSEEYEDTKIYFRETNQYYRVVNGELIYCESDNKK